MDKVDRRKIVWTRCSLKKLSQVDRINRMSQMVRMNKVDRTKSIGFSLKKINQMSKIMNGPDLLRAD